MTLPCKASVRCVHALAELTGGSGGPWDRGRDDTAQTPGPGCLAQLLAEWSM